MINDNLKLKDIIKHLKEFKAKNQYNKILKIAIVRSYSCEILKKILMYEAFKIGIKLEVFIGEYNQYRQELIDYNSELYKFNPDVIVLDIGIDSINQEIDNHICIENTEEIITRIVDEYTYLIDHCKNKTDAFIFTISFIRPITVHRFIYDSVSIRGLNYILNKVNISIMEKILDNRTFVIDSNEIINMIGESDIYDEKMYILSKNPYKIHFYYEIAKKIAKMIDLIFVGRKKCLIIDLDNTIWDGVIGEDGLNGIKIDYYFKQIQSLILDYKNSGVVLAICSKNNINDVIEVFNKRDDMILKLNDFSIIKANWNEKYVNIDEISRELNIGLESMVFIDDSKFECDIVSSNLKEIDVVHLGDDKTKFIEKVSNIRGLDFINITNEDRKKTDIYRDNARRQKFKTKFNSLDEYLKSMEIKVRVLDLDDSNIQRAAQLAKKTNQFNLTTKRYSEKDFIIMRKSNYIIKLVSVSDKFGENGLSGMFVIKTKGDKWIIDTLLLSCRILKRNIEKAIMNYIINMAMKNRIKTIIGIYVPTRKNGLTKGFYKESGFEFNQESGLWEFNLDKNNMDYIDYIEIK